MHEFETTHLKSQAGTGASGIFMEEAAFLNPSTLAFFTQGSVYAQRDMLQIKDAKGDVIQKPKNTAIVLADGNPNLSGSLSYVAQEEGVLRRKRWGLSTSSPLSDKSAFGVSLRRTKDENLAAHSDVEYWQTVFGITHAIDPRTSLGLVAYDAFNSKGNATKAIVGAQHVFVDYITLAFDIGGNYKSDEISDSLLYRGSIQVRVLNDIYLRFGGFSDKEYDEKGSGFGVGWTMPRMNLEFALKNTKQTADTSIGRPESKIKEASFALGLRF